MAALLFLLQAGIVPQGCVDTQFLSELALKMHCQFSFLTLPSQMARKRQLNWQSASKKEKVKTDYITWRAVGCHEKAIIAAASRAVRLMCSLEELAPRQTGPRGLSMQSTSMKMSTNRSSPSLVLHCWFKRCTESHTNASPTWGISVVFLKTTPQCRTTTHRCLFSRHRGQLLWNLAAGHSQSWRATENCMQQHWTAPNARCEPHQSTGILSWFRQG